MNNFTKEELITLKNGMEYLPDAVHLSKSYLEHCERITDKIQFMIDNYCEHNERVASADENGHMLVMCGRCDLVLWHEKS